MQHHGAEFEGAKAENNGECQQNEAVEDVAEHHAKEEGECHSRVDSRIDLFVERDTIRIDYLLERPHEVVRFNESRSLESLLVKLNHFSDLRYLEIFACTHLCDLFLQDVLILRWAPEKPRHEFLAIILQLVQFTAYSFFFDNEPFHDLYLRISMVRQPTNSVEGFYVFLELLFCVMY